MSYDVGEATEGSENELRCVWAEHILQPFRHFSYVTAHYPTLPSLYLGHSSFSNASVASPTSQLILQPFFRFSYVTDSSLTSFGEPPKELWKTWCAGWPNLKHHCRDVEWEWRGDNGESDGIQFVAEKTDESRIKILPLAPIGPPPIPHDVTETRTRDYSAAVEVECSNRSTTERTKINN